MSGLGERPLRVALLNPTFWPEVQRGSERLIHSLATDLLRLGHRPKLITSHPGRPERSVEDGLEVLRHWRPPDAPLRLRRFQEHLTHVPSSYLSLRAGEFDVADAFYPTDALAAVRWGEQTGRPAVLSYTGIPQRNVVSNKRLRLKIFERAARDSDAVVVISRAAREGMWRWLGVEARVIYPGVDLNLFAPGGERTPEPTIACAAAIDDGRKRIDLLVRAFRHVRREHKRARLLLVGPGNPANAARYGNPSDGIEVSTPPPGRLAPVLRQSWASGLASYNEAFGLALVESLACGTPVFGARDGGIPEIVDRPEIGRLFEGDDERDVARAILDTLELAGEPTTAEACRRRAKDFDTTSNGRAYEALYWELISGR